MSTCSVASKQAKRTVFTKVMPLYDQHNGRIEFFMFVHDSQEVARISLGKDLAGDEKERYRSAHETYH